MPQRVAFLIGVTGHRDLRESDLPALKSAVRSILKELHTKYPQTSFLLLSPLAEGADRLVAQVALELAAEDTFPATIELVVPLPWPQDVCADLLHRTGARGEFDVLLNQATQIIEMPLVKGITAEDIARSEEARARQYREVGRFIARHSQILLALWDDVAESEGGTARVIHWQQAGVDAPFAKVPQPLDENEGGPVYRIAAPRNQRETHLQPGEITVLYPDQTRSAPENENYFHTMWSSINDFNQDVSVGATAFQAQTLQSRDWVIPAAEQSELTPSHQELLALYASADAAAQHYQRRTNQSLCSLFLLVGVAVCCFELYTHLLINSWGLLMTYIALLITGAVVFRFITRQKYHDKFVDYRSLAEALRVQLFWRLAGLQLTISDHYLRSMRSELDWIRQAVRSCQLMTGAYSRIEQESVRSQQARNFELIKQRWVENQRNYYSQSAEKNLRTEHLWERGVRYCYLLAVMLAVVMLILHLKNQHLNHVLAVLVFVAAAAAALLHEFGEKSAFSVLGRRYEWMYSLFTTADNRLAEELASDNYEAATELIQLLGEDALIENADWVIQTRHRQPELPAPG